MCKYYVYQLLSVLEAYLLYDSEVCTGCNKVLADCITFLNIKVLDTTVPIIYLYNHHTYLLLISCASASCL